MPAPAMPAIAKNAGLAISAHSDLPKAFALVAIMAKAPFTPCPLDDMLMSELANWLFMPNALSIEFW